ncbi:MAG: ornithine carbamoyltransferase [Alphaproteobacteria bacterium]
MPSTETAPRHFLDLDLLGAPTLREIVDRAVEMKRHMKNGKRATPLAGKTLAMIFEKPSTRTRVSFDVAMRQLGGETIILNPDEMQLGRGESIADTAQVLSRYVDAIMIRTSDHAKLVGLADNATVPVINGLTDRTHPCQVMADVMTFEEHRGPIKGRVVVWAGDGNNMAASWIHAAVRFDFELRLACPAACQPATPILDWARANAGRVTVTEDVDGAIAGANCVVTDTWVSMNDRRGAADREILRPYRIDERLMGLARPDAIFMHCLPAIRGEEVTSGVIDGPQSVVWDEVENRLHAQKSILLWCLS